MDQIQRDKIAAKLKKIKALAERGVGGEKETAMRMYEDLKARYELEDEEIMLDAVTLHWFGYADELEERSRGMAAGMKILENCKYILIGNKYGVSDGMKAEMTLAALKGKVMLYEQDGKIYLVDSREETTGGQDNE